MNNEFYEHKRSDAVKWVIVFVLIAVLLGGMVAALVFAVPSADGAEKSGNGDGVTDVSKTTEGAVTLSAGIAFTASDPETGAKSVSKTITATVLPVDAPDKSVDWSLTWCVPLEDEDVGDYLRHSSKRRCVDCNRNRIHRFRGRKRVCHRDHPRRRLHGVLPRDV